ncbi:MAG: hypothetical protein IH968_07295 [Gemmatimonadetes bacterium]|nr:hypothetical protein [Gemmatimonadota bacterium]
MSTSELKWGTYGGVAGGLVSGAMMGIMGVGFVVHMVNSAIIGAGFAIVLGRFVSGALSGLGAGLVYGGAWWILGPLTLMPMGFGVNWNAAAAAVMVPSLVGHLMYGSILGLVYTGSVYPVPARS